MTDPLKHGLRPVPFRRLVRTSSAEPNAGTARRITEEDEYGYGCVEWFQYPGQRNRKAGLSEARRRAAGR